jgi:hypothetical protein
MWNLISVHLDTMLVSVDDRCMVCAKRTISSEKSFWIHPMVLLGDLGHVESSFGPCGDSVSVSVRYVHSLRQTYHWLRNGFG